MDLIYLIFFLCIVGAVVHFLLERFVVDPWWKTTLRIAALAAVVFYLLRRFGVVPPNILP